jgi:hypothetical protein
MQACLHFCTRSNTACSVLIDQELIRPGGYQKSSCFHVSIPFIPPQSCIDRVRHSATETERDLSKRTANGEDDEPSYQCISLSATMKIASLFELHPMVLGAAHTEWGIKQQLIRSATAKGKGKIGAHDRGTYLYRF